MFSLSWVAETLCWLCWQIYLSLVLLPSHHPFPKLPFPGSCKFPMVNFLGSESLKILISSLLPPVEYFDPLLILSNTIKKLYSPCWKRILIFPLETVLKNIFVWVLDRLSNPRNRFLLNRILILLELCWSVWRRVLLCVPSDKYVYILGPLSHWDELLCHF